MTCNVRDILARWEKVRRVKRKMDLFPESRYDNSNPASFHFARNETSSKQTIFQAVMKFHF